MRLGGQGCINVFVRGKSGDFHGIRREGSGPHELAARLPEFSPRQGARTVEVEGIKGGSDGIRVREIAWRWG